MPGKPTNRKSLNQADVPEAISLTLDMAFEKRLHTLLDRHSDAPGRKAAILSAIAGLRPRDRVRILLVIASGCCAIHAGTLTPKQTKTCLNDLGKCGGRFQNLKTPEGRYVERHKMLLARLVYRGCLRRGEIAHPGAFTLIVKNGDLLPIFRSGDILLVAPNQEPQPGQKAIIRDGRRQRLIFWPREGRPARRNVIGVVQGRLKGVDRKGDPP